MGGQIKTKSEKKTKKKKIAEFEPKFDDVCKQVKGTCGRTISHVNN